MAVSSLQELNIFNNSNAIIEGWYWAMPSKSLKKGKIKHLNLMGKELAIYRDEDGEVRTVAAYCPHMGAHLAEGRVEGKGIRCFFHHWKFDEAGNLADIPCRENISFQEKITSYPTEEKYGMIWVWTGPKAKRKIPYVPELENEEVDWAHGKPYIKECHPNVMMINAIDAHHFYSVHNLPVKLNLEPEIIDSNTIKFSNTTKVPQSNFLVEALK